MSQQGAAPQLPDPNDAAQTVFNRVEAEAFFGKLASYGIQPANEEEAIAYLKLGNDLLLREAQNPPAQRNLASEVSQSLGLGKQAAAEQHRREISDVAAHLMRDPDLYNSVLSVKAAEAQLHADEIAQRMAVGS